MAIASGKLRVFIETPSGEVIEATGHVKNITIEQGMSGYLLYGADYASSSMTFELVCVDHRIFTSDSFKKRVSSAKHANEWKCSWCGTVNPIAATFCGELHRNAVGCSGHRSLIYDL